MPLKPWPTDKRKLLELGKRRVQDFCEANDIVTPTFEEDGPWYFDHCAYYRDNVIHICVDRCGFPCGEAESRNWTWPGSTTDREPYGVVCHELGHHCDMIASKKKDRYRGDYSASVRSESKEAPITSYCPDDGEWFAEMFRLFVTNPDLLSCLRPRTFAILMERWNPVGLRSWRSVLGANVPARVIRTLKNKGAV